MDRLTMAALAVTALVALGGCASAEDAVRSARTQSTGAPGSIEAAAAPPAAAPTTAPPGGQDIRAVDLRRTLLADPAVSADVKTALRDSPYSGLNPVYQDVTHDGVTDVVVDVASGGTMGLMASYGYSYQHGRLVQVFAYESETGKFTTRVTGGDVVVTQGIYRDGDGGCCPSGSKTVRYSWNGSRLVPAGG